MIPEDIDEAVLAAAVKASMRAHTLKIGKVLVSAPAGATAPESALDNLAEDDLPDDDDDEDGAPKRPVLRKPAASGIPSCACRYHILVVLLTRSDRSLYPARHEPLVETGQR